MNVVNTASMEEVIVRDLFEHSYCSIHPRTEHRVYKTSPQMQNGQKGSG